MHGLYFSILFAQSCSVQACSLSHHAASLWAMSAHSALRHPSTEHGVTAADPELGGASTVQG